MLTLDTRKIMKTFVSLKPEAVWSLKILLGRKPLRKHTVITDTQQNLFLTL